MTRDVKTYGTAEPPAALRVAKGHPTDEELAAVLIAVRANAATRRRRASVKAGERGWSDRTRQLRRCPPAASGAWRASAWVDR